MRFTGPELAILTKNYIPSTNGTGIQISSSVEGVAGLASINGSAAAHLLTERGDLFWRSETLVYGTDVFIAIDFGTARKIDTVVLSRSNLREGYISYSHHNADPFPVVAGVPASAAAQTSAQFSMVVQATPDDYTFETFPWLTGPGEERLDELQTSRRLVAVATAPAYASRYLLIKLEVWSSGTNGLNDYFEAALPFAGLSWRPDMNMEYGWRIRPERDSKIFQTLDSNLGGVELPAFRVLSFQLPHMREEARAWSEVDATSEAGKLGAVWFWAEPSKPHLFYSQSFPATIVEAPGIGRDDEAWPTLDSWTLREIR